MKNARGIKRISNYKVQASGEIEFTILNARYKTDKHGDGLWCWVKSDSVDMQTLEPVMEWRQVTGTCQFSLTGRYPTDYKRIMRYFFHPRHEESYA